MGENVCEKCSKHGEWNEHVLLLKTSKIRHLCVASFIA